MAELMYWATPERTLYPEGSTPELRAKTGIVTYTGENAVPNPIAGCIDTDGVMWRVILRTPMYTSDPEAPVITFQSQWGETFGPVGQQDAVNKLGVAANRVFNPYSIYRTGNGMEDPVIETLARPDWPDLTPNA